MGEDLICYEDGLQLNEILRQTWIHICISHQDFNVVTDHQSGLLVVDKVKGGYKLHG